MRRTFTTSPVGLGLVALVAMLLVAPAAWAQQTGSIAGQVTDTTGGALPGVTVEVSSPALIGGTQVAFTDGEGRYLLFHEFSQIFRLGEQFGLNPEHPRTLEDGIEFDPTCF